MCKFRSTRGGYLYHSYSLSNQSTENSSLQLLLKGLNVSLIILVNFKEINKLSGF